MHNTLSVTNTPFQIYTMSKTQLKKMEPEHKNIVSNNKNDILMNNLKAMSNISFAGLFKPANDIQHSIGKALAENISKEIPINSSEYKFLRRNPIGFYLEYGKEVNKFLRKGAFDDIPEIDNDIPEKIRYILQNQNNKIKETNRTIMESLPTLDSLISSKTDKDMVVYRDAPKSWLTTAKDGILHDNGFISTSTEKGASMEGLISNGADNYTYEIRLPKGTPFLDLTFTPEKEMLLARNADFKIINPGVLELIL